jgi:hypothetical protein
VRQQEDGCRFTHDVHRESGGIPSRGATWLCKPDTTLDSRQTFAPEDGFEAS